MARVLIAKPVSTFAEHGKKKERPVSRLPFGAFQELRRFNRTRRTHFVHRLLGRGFRHRNNRYESAAVGFCTKHDMAFDLGEQGMVGAHADIKAGMPGGVSCKSQ